MARWAGDRVSLEDSIAVDSPAGGQALRESFPALIPSLTIGLINAAADTLRLGPIELLRLGRPAVTRTGVEWPIEGGWAVGAPGGTWRLESEAGRLTASVNGYRPRLPRLIYSLTQLPVHRLVTRLYLLRMAGQTTTDLPEVVRADRLRAAAIDLAVCVALTGLTRRPRMSTFLGITAGYHLACWTLSGRTAGGLAMNQRLVAADGSRVSAAQATVRLLALPLSLMSRRIDPDEISGTRVIGAGH